MPWKIKLDSRILNLFHRHAEVKSLKHFKKFEQTELVLEQSQQIKLFDRIMEDNDLTRSGIILTSSGYTTINMKWNNEGPPKFADIHLEIDAQIAIGMERKSIHVSLI